EITLDPAVRLELLKQLDGLLANSYQYTLRWYDPAQRVVYLNKCGMPPGGLSQVGYYNGELGPGIPQLWWVVPEKSRKLDQAMRDNSVRLEIPAEEDHYWQNQASATPK